MITYYECKNGIRIRVKTPVHELMLIDETGKELLSCNLIHGEFERGVYRNMFGSHNRETYRALEEYAESVGIKLVPREREDKTQKILIKKN